MQHQIKTSADCGCQDEVFYPVCDGGLSICKICGGAEGSLPTECPGTLMTSYAQDAVYVGKLDFVNGQWKEKKMDEYAIVEIKGHRRYGAKVSEIERYGIKMMRAEVLSDPPFVQHVHPDSIFTETPCTEAQAKAESRHVSLFAKDDSNGEDNSSEEYDDENDIDVGSP